MEKLDLTKKYKTYFTAKQKPELVDIEKAPFLSIRGQGDPNGREFANRIEALYSTAYTLKFMFKGKNKDFTVSKLEGLWWFDENKYAARTMASAAVDVPRSEWEYRLMIRLPDFVQQKDVDAAIASAIAKKDQPLAVEVEYFTMAEGKSVQMLHVGPFSSEPETLRRISGFMEINRLRKNGLHHEIYLSDFRKTEPEKLKTILREPVR